MWVSSVVLRWLGSIRDREYGWELMSRGQGRERDRQQGRMLRLGQVQSAVKTRQGLFGDELDDS